MRQVQLNRRETSGTPAAQKLWQRAAMRPATPAVPMPPKRSIAASRPLPSGGTIDRGGLAAVPGSSDAGADRLDVDRLEFLRQLIALGVGLDPRMISLGADVCLV
jgi:hypothetical protein